MGEKILSCFIDESGDFGPYDYHSPYYIVATVLHNQIEDISEQIKGLESRASNLGFRNHAIHTGPLIRREGLYKDYQIEDRKKLFNILYRFTIQLPIHYLCVKVDKAECENEIQQAGRLSKRLSTQIQDNMDFWKSFDKIVVYYDNGQTQLTRIITSVFNALFTNIEMRKVKPVDYKLFQVADLICTLEMIGEKKQMTKSELEFFGNGRSFRKDYLKKIQAKNLKVK